MSRELPVAEFTDSCSMCERGHERAATLESHREGLEGEATSVVVCLCLA